MTYQRCRCPRLVIDWKLITGIDWGSVMSSVVRGTYIISNLELIEYFREAASNAYNTNKLLGLQILPDIRPFFICKFSHVIDLG